MGMGDDYKFLRLRDAYSSINQKVNMIAVILEFGFPRPTRGTDYCCSVRIIDETHHETGMAVNIFAENAERLPHVAAAGDVIQLCHVAVKAHGGEVNAVFNKKFSSFALYKGEDGDDFAPYQVSSKFHPRDEDKGFIDKLRKWLVNLRLQDDPSNFPMLGEIKEGNHINLACKILHCCGAAKDQWFMYAWDGSDTPPNAIWSKLEGIENNHFHLLNVGKWVKFVNIRLEVHSGLWRGVFTSFTKLRYTSNEDCLIGERQRLSDERISLKSRRIPSCSFSVPSCITEVNHDLATPVTLMDVLTHSEVTAKFKCLVRVVAAMPCQADSLCSPAGIYRMRLTLEDPTARIHAFVVAEDGETLFDGYPGIYKLTMKLNRLLGVAECDDSTGVKDTPRNPPWVFICLKSYYISKTEAWGSRHFRIFDTKIVGDS
ncbi:protection of telomeres protein 1b isoform X2 [Abrus precatorius]|uniref:Protection of telomeres protein 1b isoform X2 n=1 Tax=Abrus precatorius TaxID=3816 RepID=A0A8B8K867_ABRPR|nr:protection of telomeres protein 1b isoform X2 [Abrus precatorius]